MAKSKAKKHISKKKKARETAIIRGNFILLMIVSIGCIFLIMYRSVKINESFNQMQKMSKTVSNLEKENSQIAVQIQNNLNLNNIEQIASSTLGMQKLSSKQTVYISLDTKDHTEISNKKILEEEENKGFLKTIWNKIVNLF